eukprot:scaffold11746_cov109-Isochrysis_galbana.AAC.1
MEVEAALVLLCLCAARCQCDAVAPPILPAYCCSAYAPRCCCAPLRCCGGCGSRLRTACAFDTGFAYSSHFLLALWRRKEAAVVDVAVRGAAEAVRGLAEARLDRNSFEDGCVGRLLTALIAKQGIDGLPIVSPLFVAHGACQDDGADERDGVAAEL